MRISPINNFISYKSKVPLKPVPEKDRIARLRDHSNESSGKPIYATAKSGFEAMSEKERVSLIREQFQISINNEMEYFRKKGYDVRKRLDHKLVISSDKEINLTSHQLEDSHIAEINGDVKLTLPYECRTIDINNLEKVKGKLTIDCEEQDQSPTAVIFNNLRKIGKLEINNAFDVEFPELKTIKGSFKSSGTDNVALPNIHWIQGNFNVLSGRVLTNGNIFSAVQGKMNAVPPESESTIYIDYDAAHHTDKLEFLSNGSILLTRRIR